MRVREKRLALTGLAVLVVAVGSAPFPAAAQRGGRSTARRPALVVRHVSVRNSAALDHFHEALGELQAGKRRYVRVYHFGDSNVAADLWTGEVRRYLQARYGDAGPGYLLPRPHGSWHLAPTKMEAGTGFETRRHGFAKLFGPRDGLWGLSGVAMEGAGSSAWFKLQTAELPPGGGILDLHLLGQPAGGHLTVVVDRERPDDVDVALPRAGLVRQTWPLRAGRHVVQGQVVGAQPVRVLGMVVEYRQPGVVYDTLGINGHRVTAINIWSEPLLSSQFRARPPDLVVLSYGSNEGLSTTLTLDEYEAGLRRAIQRVRRLAPQASCLLVGPVAMCPEPEKVTQVNAIQRRVAPEYSCGFWESSQVSGGPGSLCNWIAADPTLVGRDHLHLRQGGYEIMARELIRAIVP
jgi:lysophospholipase L1-like esterase